VLHLQPILELAIGKVRHGELLLRMRGDRGKLIAPGAFLPAAERFGLIHAIDRWVVQEAIRMIAGAPPGQTPRLGVNLSGESVVGDPELLSMIERELDEAEVDPSSLIFEITETAAIANMAEATRFAQGLTNLGCSLALDDFGTGFGSSYYLKHLPVRYVKLDGEFIHNLPRNPIRRARGQGDRRRRARLGHSDRRRVGRRRRDDREAAPARRRLRAGLSHRQARARAGAVRVRLGAHRRGRGRARLPSQVRQVIGLAVDLASE
jgi:hypothetical protein